MADNHTGEKATGRLKEAAGALTNDDDLKREGKADQASAGVKEKVDKAVDKVSDAIGNITDKKD